MEDKDFTPYSSPIPIAGTSYSAQIGKSGAGRWKIRLIKGKNVMGTEEFDELNGNLMIAFIMRETAIPMLNPYKISQNIKMLIKQAERGPLQAKLPPSPAPTANQLGWESNTLQAENNKVFIQQVVNEQNKHQLEIIKFYYKLIIDNKLNITEGQYKELENRVIEALFPSKENSQIEESSTQTVPPEPPKPKLDIIT